jgi:hypothetical protein
MSQRVFQPELGSERLPKARSVITHDRQAAALFGSLQCESGDDGVSSDFQGASKMCDVSSTVLLFCEEVERRPIMPNVVFLGWLPRRDVRNNPTHRECQDFRVRAGIMGEKESQYVSTQRTCDPE